MWSWKSWSDVYIRYTVGTHAKWLMYRFKRRKKREKKTLSKESTPMATADSSAWKLYRFNRAISVSLQLLLYKSLAKQQNDTNWKLLLLLLCTCCHTPSSNAVMSCRCCCCCRLPTKSPDEMTRVAGAREHTGKRKSWIINKTLGLTIFYACHIDFDDQRCR